MGNFSFSLNELMVGAAARFFETVGPFGGGISGPVADELLVGDVLYRIEDVSLRRHGHEQIKDPFGFDLIEERGGVMFIVGKD